MKYVINLPANYMADTLQNELTKKTIWKNVGIVSHNLPLIATLSICENIMLPMQYFENMKNHQAETIVLSLLGKFEMEKSIYHKPKSLNDYEILIAKFLRAIVREPQHVFFILPHKMIPTEEYENFVHFVESINDFNIIIVENSKYVDEYSKINFTEIPYQQWQTLVLKTLK